MKLLALAGSLRKRSYNRVALEALRELAPNNLEIVIGDISRLPLFNPDLDDQVIDALVNINVQLADSAGLIIASPEYAHGISGPMKNALDWLVSGVEFPGKPIMLVNTSPRASHALASLREVLVTMSGSVIEDACVDIPLLGSELDMQGVLQDQVLSDALKNALDRFHKRLSVTN
ncbi:NADPH-dependent FMN reductase [Arenicella xantha]|uniref:NAD(P)H-dependent FMN reductase n=1 Tax=Arenicella xantha TaxID=644221 RepID=A0A395JLQ6_9GAMM|nr:NADPH-dependent FMN reductase [Arenicella xantha]RBP49898.1 NAD(P)H-dependent FMN reductase [Arenicella xantha]